MDSKLDDGKHKMHSKLDVGKCKSLFAKAGLKDIKPLKSGGQGQVFVATNKEGKKVIAKVYPNVTQEASVKMFNTAKMLRDKCRNGLICYHERFSDGDTSMVIMDYLEMNDLREVLDDYVDNKRRFVARQIYVMIKKLCEILKILKTYNLVHIDIKPENILINNADELTLNLIDLDYMCEIYSEGDTVSCDANLLSGTREYMSPEQILVGHQIGQRKKYEEVIEAYEYVYDVEYNRIKFDKIDVYSLGVVLHQLLTHDLPYNIGEYLDNYDYLTERLIQGDRQVKIKPFQRDEFRVFKKLVESMLEYDPQKRFSIDDCLAEIKVIREELKKSYQM
jgi:serine/threonine protein kinase